MKIKVWGCRGSLPAPGRSTIRYGGNTTCLEVRLSDNTLIVLDAGSGIKKLGKTLFDFTAGGPEKRSIGSAEIVLIRLNHPNGGYGFKIVAFVFLSDNELDFEYRGGMTTSEYKSASLLIHDAQYLDFEQMTPVSSRPDIVFDH
jgi:hypothetical protein